jgi:teichoic acid transport system permease protein
MNLVLQIMKEQIHHINLIFRLSSYDVKSKYRMHYLGAFWQILNPLVQVMIYWFVFGIGLRGGAPVGDTPFFLWLIVGLYPWIFINQTITLGSNSVYSKIQLVAKMKFPVSVLPVTAIVGNLYTFLILMVILILLLLLNGVTPGIYLLQLPYYIVCMFFLLLGITLLLSTVTTIIRDIQNLVQYVMRMMLYVLPILWNVDELPELFVDIFRLNPIFYIIEGFRFSFLGGEWFYQDIAYMLYFWLITFLILLMGSFVHIKFRHKFIDYI